MPFKTRKINNGSKIINFLLQKTTIIVFVLFLLFAGIYISYSYFQDNKVEIIKKTISTVTKVLGEDLKKNEFGTTNILLMGSGGKDHEGGYLTDSLIVATLNYELKTVSMLSIPRDIHVKYFIEKNKRSGKINRVFMEGMNYWKSREDDKEVKIEKSSKYIKNKIEEMINQDIQYVMYIDFQGFVKVVDSIGGLKINVEKDIYDPLYPGPNHTYRTFALQKGEQILTGETALKYVRSRHGNSGGDFGRSYRQKKTLVALKKQAIEMGILTSPSQLKLILDIIKDNFWTDISWQEMLSFVEFIQSITKEDIITGGVQDLSNQNKEWFLYTPPRDLFGGQSVFLPCRIYSKMPWSDIQMYRAVMIEVPELITSSILSVYNTTSVPGLAHELEVIFNRYGITPLNIGTKKYDLDKSVIEYNPTERNKVIAEFLGYWLELPIQENTNLINENSINQEEKEDPIENFDVSDSEINIYIGDDYVKNHRDRILWFKKCL